MNWMLLIYVIDINCKVNTNTGKKIVYDAKIMLTVKNFEFMTELS